MKEAELQEKLAELLRKNGSLADLINEEIVGLFKSYKEKYYVCVELGLQTSNDELGKKINRCYTSKQFTEAVKILNKRGKVYGSQRVGKRIGFIDSKCCWGSKK